MRVGYPNRGGEGRNVMLLGIHYFMRVGKGREGKGWEGEGGKGREGRGRNVMLLGIHYFMRVGNRNRQR